MKKIQITSLGMPSAAQETQTITVNDIDIEVKKRIPYEELIEAIEWCVNSIIDDRSYISAPVQFIIQEVALVKFFTNLDTSDAMTENFSLSSFYEWYDILQANDIPDSLHKIIDKKQLSFLTETLDRTLNSIISYRNSAVGIVDRLTEQNRLDKLNMDTVLDELDKGEYQKIIDLMNAMANDGV